MHTFSSFEELLLRGNPFLKLSNRASRDCGRSENGL